ncbi:MAG: hypothetical protein AAFN41_12640 [Planctomycetota bacterium]
MEHLELGSMELELAAKREAFRREHERDLSVMLKSNMDARAVLASHARELWASARRARRERGSRRSLAAE